MKFLIFFTILASMVACIFACNPDGSNEPTCDKSNLEKPIRNFWNSNNYWLCKEAGGKAESVICPDAQGFDENKGECVPFIEFKWIEPCSKAQPVTEPVTEADAETEPDVQSVPEHDAEDDAEDGRNTDKDGANTDAEVGAATDAEDGADTDTEDNTDTNAEDGTDTDEPDAERRDKTNESGGSKTVNRS